MPNAGVEAAAMVKRRWFAVLAAVALIGSAAPAGATLPGASFLVVPGRSAGGVALGMKLWQVEAVLGRPQRTDRGARAAWYTWRDRPPRSFEVEMVAGVVILISIAHDPRYRTREGVGEGDTEAGVRRVYGRPSSVMHLAGYDMIQYASRGLGFVVEARGAHVVTGILVGATMNGRGEPVRAPGPS